MLCFYKDDAVSPYDLVLKRLFTRGVFRTQSNIYNEAFCENSQH